MDPLWSINTDVKATSRSRNFGKTLEFFLDHIKGDIQGEDEGGCALQEKKSQAENTLLHLVTVLAGPDLASWVQSFIDKTVLPESGDSHLHGNSHQNSHQHHPDRNTGRQEQNPQQGDRNGARKRARPASLEGGAESSRAQKRAKVINKERGKKGGRQRRRARCPNPDDEGDGVQLHGETGWPDQEVSVSACTSTQQRSRTDKDET